MDLFSTAVGIGYIYSIYQGRAKEGGKDLEERHGDRFDRDGKLIARANRDTLRPRLQAYQSANVGNRPRWERQFRDTYQPGAKLQRKRAQELYDTQNWVNTDPWDYTPGRKYGSIHKWDAPQQGNYLHPWRSAQEVWETNNAVNYFAAKHAAKDPESVRASAVRNVWNDPVELGTK